MNKEIFIRKVSENVAETLGKSTLKETTVYVDAFLEELKNILVADEKVSFVGFGSFETIKRKAGVGRNPKTGEPVDIQASRLVKFKTSAKLKEAINEV
jgi:DNA-binding protein HU-beta